MELIGFLNSIFQIVLKINLNVKMINVFLRLMYVIKKMTVETTLMKKSVKVLFSIFQLLYDSAKFLLGKIYINYN